MNKIKVEFPFLEPHLKEVHETIISELTTSESDFNNDILKYFNEKAKLIRPTLTLLAAGFKNEIKDTEIVSAAAMEILHVASLIHDDVIDEADLRRGIETINKKHGVGYAVICGDYLFAKSFEMLFNVKNYNALTLIGSNTVDMCFGEVEQHLRKLNKNIDFDSYIDIIDKKTSSLFQSNLACGATLTKMSEKDVDKLIEYGKYFGRIFQIADDIKDFTNNQSALGKPVFHDIDKGIYSLPIIFAQDMELITSDDLSRLSNDEVYNLILSNKLIDKSRELVDEYYESAINCLCDFDNEYKSNFIKLLDLIVGTIK